MGYIAKLLCLGLGLSAVVGLQMRGDEPTTSRVMYGFETCNRTWANNAMDAAKATWLEHLPRQNLVIAGGAYDDALDNALTSQNVVTDPNPCPDALQGLACKEAVMLYRASVRMNQVAGGLGADWLVVGQEDKYINTVALEKFLERYDPSTPGIVSAFGCGRGWEFASKALGHVGEARPRGWVDPQYQCKAVFENAGICGGPTYAVSRSALELLRQPGQTLDEFVKEFLASSEVNIPGASDIASSCFFYKRGIPLHSREFYPSEPLRGSFVPTEASVDQLGKAITYHLSVYNKESLPEIMRQLHRRFNQGTLTALERSLFAETVGHAFYLQYPDIVWPSSVPFN